jgi:hypothetical protein
VAFSPTTLQTTPAIEDSAIQQQTSHDFGRIRQFTKKLLARLAHCILVQY